MSIEDEEIPQVGPEDRVELRDLGEGFYEVVGHYGFMESPDIPALLESLRGAAASKPSRLRPVFSLAGKRCCRVAIPAWRAGARSSLS